MFRGGEWLTLAFMMIPRAVIWALFIRWYYRPLGGPRVLAWWTLLGVVLSTLTDTIILTLFKEMGLWLGMC
jgi:hypothetical protein